MATTTNYGWTTPDDTALVKDGASAIRTLGSSIDTTTKNLNPQTTTGAIAYRSATSNVNTSLPIGTAGQVLTVNSGATAPEWATPASGGMTLINTGGTALSGASTTVSSIPATYYNLFVVVQGFKTSHDGDTLIGRFNSDSNTRYSALGYTQQNNQSFGQTYLEFSNAQDNSVATNLSYFTIPDYANTTTWKMLQGFSIQVNATTTTNFNILPLSSFYNQTAAISSITFLGLNANFTGGTVYVYGVK
jgi:hypothetical protein